MTSNSPVFIAGGIVGSTALRRQRREMRAVAPVVPLPPGYDSPCGGHAMTLTDEPVATRPPPSNQRPPDAHGKALSMNLDASTYGTFAEIGAGREVARWFLTVGAASVTVAQTISAYDKTFSDSEYGRGTRYVSRERLLAMLDHAYMLLRERLHEPR